MSKNLATLICHPDNTCNAIRSISVNMLRKDYSSLNLRYCLEGELSRLLIPAAGRTHRADGLWKQTCFEAFFKTKKAYAYCEFNICPSTAWAAYRFGGYRKGMKILEVASVLKISVEANDKSLIVDVVLDLKNLPNWATLFLALAAVVKSTDNQLSYWALAHPPGKPDFHHRDSFLIPL